MTGGIDMFPMLLLTKNVLSEIEFQKKLHYLNHEVFCSTSVLGVLNSDIDITQNLEIYQVIILSETIPNKEVENIMPKIISKNRVIFRKILEEPKKKDEEFLIKNGITGFLRNGISSDSLREEIASKIDETEIGKSMKNFSFTMHSSRFKEVDNKYRLHLDEATLRFSKLERQIFQKLISVDGKVVSREDLCRLIWNEEQTNSHMSQLSLLIKNIRMKLFERGFDGEIVETVWGQGYRLANSEYRIVTG